MSTTSTAAGGGTPRNALTQGGADAAAWAGTSEATRLLAEQTLEVLRNREFVTRLAERYAGHTVEQRAGHMAEVMHALSFNLDAIRNEAEVRARVTEWAVGGSQNGPVDIKVVDPSGVVGEAQVKFVDKVPNLTREVGDPAYRDMDRVVPSDRLADLEDKLDKVLQRPAESERYHDYADARARIDDRLRHNGVESDPVTYDEAQDAARDPHSWQQRQEYGAAAREVGMAVAAGALIGGGITLVVTAATEAARCRAGETTIAGAAATACGAAAKAAVRSGAIAGTGQAISVAARAGHLPQVLGGGTLPYALAGAAFAVGASGLAFARGEIGAADFAAASAESVTRSALVWGCGVVGQTVIPVPVVGALVGGTVGQVAATIMVEGLRLAIAAGRAERADEERLRRLEGEVYAAVELSEALREATAALGAEHNAYVSEVVLPEFAGLERLLASEDPGAALAGLASLTRRFGGTPLYSRLDEFERWMADPTGVLVLNPNGTGSAPL